MQISASMTAKLNEQITHELGASQSYLATACHFADLGLSALAALFRKQAEEERGHALKILDYILEVGGHVNLAALPAPTAAYANVLAAVEAALANEQLVTRQIHDLVALAEQEKDYATRSFLQWFVDEQVEEVASMCHLRQVVQMAGDQLLQLETYLSRAGQAS
jgi:ferritin